MYLKLVKRVLKCMICKKRFYLTCSGLRVLRNASITLHIQVYMQIWFGKMWKSPVWCFLYWQGNYNDILIKAVIIFCSTELQIMSQHLKTFSLIYNLTSFSFYRLFYVVFLTGNSCMSSQNTEVKCMKGWWHFREINTNHSHLVICVLQGA